MDSKARPKQNTSPGLPVIAAALMLSATTQAATNAVIPCEQVGRDLQSLDVSVTELGVDAVDHAPIDTDIIDEEIAARESIAPVLNLGPRVTSILRDVFDATTDELLQESSEPPSSSPLADTDEEKGTVEADDASREETEISRFQRRMLRTDI